MQSKEHLLASLTTQILKNIESSLHARNNQDDTINKILFDYLSSSANPNKDQEIGLSEKKLQSTLNFIDKNIKNNITLKELAEAANLSEFHFSRMFKKTTQKPPLQFVAERRMELAKELLKNTDKAVTWISYELGYKSSAYFSNKFKKIVGSTPSE